MAAKGALDPPGDLDRPGKALWRATIAALKAQSTWEASDAGALERYVRAVERGRQAREARGGELVAVGSQGQPTQHPNLKTEREADRDAHDFARELLLSPASRQRHEIEVQKGRGKFDGKL